MLRLFHSKLHSIYITFSNGLLTNNSTWCQNRGCICISLVRRTYGRIHIPATIILWTELFPKKRREKIQGEILQIYLRVQNTVVFPHFYKNYMKSNIPTSFPVIPCYSTYRINSSTRILQEILQLQGSSCADQYKASSSDCPRVSKHSTRQNPAIRPLQHKQASSNSTR